MILGGDTGETGGELAGIVWEEMGWMGVQGAVQGAGRGRCKGRAGRRPGGGAADTGGARVFRRSRNGLRPVGVPHRALPCMGKRISKTPKRPRSDAP